MEKDLGEHTSLATTPTREDIWNAGNDVAALAIQVRLQAELVLTMASDVLDDAAPGPI
jgi:hypothetical protein